MAYTNPKKNKPMEDKIIVKDTWAEKYVKDNVWFPFGTIVNGWVALKKDTSDEYKLEDYKRDVGELYDLAITATIATYKIYEHLEVEKETKENFSFPDFPKTIDIEGARNIIKEKIKNQNKNENR